MANSPSELMKFGTPVGVAIRGRLYTFRYIAKEKTTPYWDMYPTVMVTKLFDGGFQGLNFNYAEHEVREKLLIEMKKFFEIRGNDRFFNYKQFLVVLQQRPWRPALVCMRSYVYENLQTPLIQVANHLWDKAMLSCDEMFYKTNQISKSRTPIKSEIVWERQRLKILSPKRKDRPI